MSVKERLKIYLKSVDLNISGFEKSINVTNGYVNSISKSIGIDKIEAILEKYPNLNIEWLLTGTGEMLKTIPELKDNELIDLSKIKRPSNYTFNEPIPEYKKLKAEAKDMIPIVSIEAVAGFGSSDFSINADAIEDYCSVPSLRGKKVDFIVPVRGLSMLPKYKSGDLVACKIVSENTFIQWNEIHVIATREQGILLKRLKKGSKDGLLEAISDNPEYPPFEIPESEITGIAIVVGGICIE